MLSSNLPKDEFLFQLDDKEDESYSDPSIDTTHQFLNFSRKVTEASSMKKPVDIQLGIACGKDMLFKSPSRILRGRSPLLQKSVIISSPLVQNNKMAHLALPLNTTKAAVSPVPSTVISVNPTPMLSSSTPVKISNSYQMNNSSSLHGYYHLSQSNTGSTPAKSTSSPLLDSLVADVLNHIESCPDHSAYSDDLDRLKLKLQAYTITRSTIKQT